MQPCPDQFVSGIFVVPKPDKTYRLVINLKKPNEFVDCPHFKMEDYRIVCNIMQKDCFMGSIDLKDAYHLIAVHESHRKYLRFKWKDELYEYMCLSFGLSTAPRVFTKLLKPVIFHLRKLGFLSCIYLDDILLFGPTYETCKHNIDFTSQTLSELGLLINDEKSVFQPTQLIRYLGFVFNSVETTISLPTD